MQKNTVGNRLWVGVDGGGTKCRAVVFDDQLNELGQGLGGPANIAKYGHQALAAILQAVQAAAENAGFVLLTLPVS